MVRLFYWDRITAFNIPFGTISSCTLLLIIYATFCETFAGDLDVDAITLLSVVVFVVSLQALEIFTMYAFG